jgi:hypothetical protein
VLVVSDPAARPYSSAGCTDRFFGTYYANATSFGEEWIRCTTDTPSFNLWETDKTKTADLGLDWISCDAYVAADGSASAVVTDPRASAATLPPGALARVNDTW